MQNHSEDETDPRVFVIEKRCDEKGMRVGGFDKLLISVIIGIIFFILATPLMFKLSNKGMKLAGLNTVNSNGVPTTIGLILHTIVFIFIIRLLMH